MKTIEIFMQNYTGMGKNGFLLVLTKTSWASSTTKQKLESNVSAWVNKGFSLFNFSFSCQNSVLEKVSNFPYILFRSFSTKAFKQQDILENLVLSHICLCFLFFLARLGQPDEASEYPLERVWRFLCRAVSNTPRGNSSGAGLCLNPVMVPEQLCLLCGLTSQRVGGKSAFAAFLGKAVCSDSQILSGFQTPKPLEELPLLNLGCFLSKASGSRVEAAWGCGAGLMWQWF